MFYKKKFIKHKKIYGQAANSCVLSFPDQKIIKGKNMRNSNPLLAAVGIFSTFALGACGVGQQAIDQQESRLKVTNGVAVEQNSYPEVVEIVTGYQNGSIGRCTGTFMNDYQLLTAAHCVVGTDMGDPQVYVLEEDVDEAGQAFKKAGAKALSIAVHQDYPDDQSIQPTDLAVVDFPANTSEHFAQLRTAKPKKGEDLKIVGYGNNRTYMDYFGLSGDGGGVKRDGVNVVDEVVDGYITFIGIPEASSEEVEAGTQSLAGSGDSGGPLFIDGQLAGVTSGGGLYWAGEGYLGLSYYVDLNSQSSQDFLKEALKL